MSKSLFRSCLAATPLAIATALAAAAAPAFAGDEINPTLKAAMKRDLGLSDTQVSQYQKIEHLAVSQEKKLAKEQGRNYAGSWIEKKADGSFLLVVGSTSIKPQKGPVGVEIRQMRHSLKNLESAKTQLDNMVALGGKAPKGVYSWYVDPRTNSVVVGMAKAGEQAAIDFVAASGAEADIVRFETIGSAPRALAKPAPATLALQGGSEYLPFDGANYWLCSVGFPVTKSGAQGFATAGHCGSTGDGAFVTSGRRTVKRIGSFAASIFAAPGRPNTDQAWVVVDTGNTLLPSVSGYGNGDVAVKGSAEASVGSALCRSGRTTGWHCGVIEAKAVTVTYVGDDEIEGTSDDTTVTDLTQTSACAEGGDSGGSFITSAGQAQGVLSGGNYDCRSVYDSVSTTYFRPINPILQAYSLTIKTSP